MKKILLTFALIALITTANAQYVVSAHLGGSYANGSMTPTQSTHTGISRLTGNDTVYYIPNDTITMPTPIGVSGGIKFGYQVGRIQFGISGSFSWNYTKSEITPSDYYSYISGYSDSPYFVVTPGRIPNIKEWTGWYKWQQCSFTLAPYVRYELIQMGDLAFFLEMNGYYTRSFQAKRHDYVDFVWLEMRNTIDSTYRIPDSATSLGIKITPGLSWQLNPHCYVDLYLDVMAFSYDRTTRSHMHSYESWDVIAEPNVIARREEITTTTTTSVLGFDFVGSTLLSPTNRSWVRVGFNYTF
jgi:hypothetical protein